MADANSMVRIGIVMDVDAVKKRVRVYYPEMSNMVSDWLIVPQRPFHGNAQFAPFLVDVSVEAAGTHTHEASVSYGDNCWLPRIDESVLVIYTHGFNTDGYVLGVIP